MAICCIAAAVPINSRLVAASAAKLRVALKHGDTRAKLETELVSGVYRCLEHIDVVMSGSGRQRSGMIMSGLTGASFKGRQVVSFLCCRVFTYMDAAGASAVVCRCRGCEGQHLGAAVPQAHQCSTRDGAGSAADHFAAAGKEGLLRDNGVFQGLPAYCCDGDCFCTVCALSRPLPAFSDNL